MGRAARRFQPWYESIRDDIFAWCRAWNFHPTWQQSEILQAVQDATLGRGSRKIAAKSGQGPGKTTVSVMIGTWRAARFVGALTMVTAPTMAQCRDVWLTEARKRHAEATPEIQSLITVTKSRIVYAGNHDWGVKFVTATRPENAQGRHDPHMTWIAEEASGIKKVLIEQIEGTLSNTDDLFLQIGNPNTRDCAFFDCFHRDRHLWRCFTLNAEESPDWLVNKETHKYLAAKYGKSSDVYRVRVLGEFPHKDPKCVMSDEDLEACGKLSIYQYVKVPRLLNNVMSPAKQFGIDFAAFGGDETAVYRRQGEAIVESFIQPHVDPLDTVDHTFMMQKKARWRDSECVYVPDCNGPGEGAVGRFYQLQKNIFEFRGNHASSEKEYDDRNTEAWFALAEKVRQHKIYIPHDDILIQQLATRNYNLTKQGKIVLEDKEHYKKRGFPSPDRADALVMAAYDGVQAMSTILTHHGSRKRVGMAMRKSA